MTSYRRGKLKKGGIFDIKSAARIVLLYWNEGKIPYYTIPPVSEAEPSEAKIFPEFSKEFNIDEVYKGENSFIGTLKSTVDLDPIEEPNHNVEETISFIESSEHLNEVVDGSVNELQISNNSGTMSDEQSLGKEEPELIKNLRSTMTSLWACS